jgi:hypothetical protein
MDQPKLTFAAKFPILPTCLVFYTFPLPRNAVVAITRWFSCSVYFYKPKLYDGTRSNIVTVGLVKALKCLTDFSVEKTCLSLEIRCK